MGTFLEVRVSSFNMSREQLKEALEGAFRLADVLVGEVNGFDPASGINRLNLSRDSQVSPDLFYVIKNAGRINRLTGGAFDPTVSPILKRQGFYGDMPPEILDMIPDDDAGVGMDNVELFPGSFRVVLHNSAWLDLSGIAKGYVVDRIAAHLRECGISDFLVDAGGDMYCGVKEDGRKWRIGLRKPGRQSVLAVLEVSGLAVATSGDYEKFISERGTGTEFSHIVAPSAGEMLVKVPSSFTVIAPDCLTADALATAMMVMGKRKSLELADGMESIEVIVAGMNDDPARMMFSAGAEQYISKR